MIALPFHPSNAYTVREFLDGAKDILASVEKEAKEKFPGVKFDLVSKVRPDGVYADQGVIAGCSGGLYDNIREAAAILKDKSCGNGFFSLSVYPTSVPVSLALTRGGETETLLEAGAIIKPSFCGPCFGAGDVPSCGGLSLRHTTRNFPNREGSKPGEGQIAGVALMDSRSIAATAANGGRITPATDVDYICPEKDYVFDKTVYQNRLYYGFGDPHPEEELILGPNITDWPKMYPLAKNLLVSLAAVIRDPVTTTDELIPSGETSSYRSNPLRLAEFALSRRVPTYVPASKAVAAVEKRRTDGEKPKELLDVLAHFGDPDTLIGSTQYGSCVFAIKPGDGSAREQAASCQKVLGGFANICYEFATKRYRSNCINWGILPFTIDENAPFEAAEGDHVFIPDVREKIAAGDEDFPATAVSAILFSISKALRPKRRRSSSTAASSTTTPRTKRIKRHEHACEKAFCPSDAASPPLHDLRRILLRHRHRVLPDVGVRRGSLHRHESRRGHAVPLHAGHRPTRYQLSDPCHHAVARQENARHRHGRQYARRRYRRGHVGISA